MVVLGDIFLDGGIIKAIGHIPSEIIPEALLVEVYDAKGAWITPGLGRPSLPPTSNLI